MAAWPSGLGSALQRRVPQFDSGRRLQQNEGPADWPGLLWSLVSSGGRSQRRAGVTGNSVGCRSRWLLTSWSTLGTVAATGATFGARVVDSLGDTVSDVGQLLVGFGLSDVA